MVSIETVAVTLRTIAEPGMRRKDLIAAVREQHPGISKKDVVRAAFFALIEGDSLRDGQAKQLHDFALGERGSVEIDAE